MNAIILAAGQGTRMRSDTAATPPERTLEKVGPLHALRAGVTAAPARPPTRRRHRIATRKARSAPCRAVQPMHPADGRTGVGPMGRVATSRYRFHKQPSKG